MDAWNLIFLLQLFLFFTWLRFFRFWWLTRLAERFLTRQASVLSLHEFAEDAADIREEQIPRYQLWRLQVILSLILSYAAFTLLPAVGAVNTAEVPVEGSYILNVITALMVAFTGYLWNLAKIRVDILDSECDYVNNLIANITGDGQTEI